MPDEHSKPVRTLLDQAAEDGVAVPALWKIEVGNALLVGTRRRRISAVDRTAAFQLLQKLPIEVDVETFTHAWNASLDLATRFQLTLYAACYLELAQRRALPLASLDNDLGLAARKLDIALLP